MIFERVVSEGLAHISYFFGSGRRSSIGASILCQEGYQKAYNVLGSMSAWRNAGYETVRD